MVLKYDTPNAERLRSLIASKGYGIVEFSDILYGKGKGRNVLGELKNRPDMRSSTLVKICRLLNVSMDVLFSDEEENNKSTSTQTIDGNHNIVNSTVKTTDYLLLKSQLEAQKLLLEEKDARINELKKHNEDLGKRLDMVLQLGQKQN